MRVPPGLTEDALAAAAAEPDPESLAALTRLREQFGPERAATAVTQVVLRRAAAAKFGAAAAQMFFTRDGLEQATRPAVAAHRAGQFRAAGVERVVDLGCGIGADALAFASAGMAVVAVESEADTAAVAAANLAPYENARVVTGDAHELAAELLADPRAAAFCDPSRRTAQGRTWRTADFRPEWAFVRGLLDGSRPVCVKVGPGVPYAEIPRPVTAEWVSHSGDVVEAALWRLPDRPPGRRATLVPAGETRIAELPEPRLPVRAPSGYVYEPDGAAIRAGLVAGLGAELGLARMAPQIAYLTGEDAVVSPWLTGYRVLDVMPAQEKVLRAWVRERGIGVLEIKKRGLDLDPAQLRRRLRLSGPTAATLLLTPTPAGARALLVSRAAA